MVSFAQPLFWQIKYVVNGLSKKTQKQGLNELHNLIAAYGYDAQVFFLRVLIEECAANNWQPTGQRTFQMQLLASELKEMESEESFGMLLCQAIEQCRDNVTEEFLSQLTKASKISLKPQLNLAAAMLQSIPQEKEASRREVAKFLKGKLRTPAILSPASSRDEGEAPSQPCLFAAVCSFVQVLALNKKSWKVDASRIVTGVRETVVLSLQLLSIRVPLEAMWGLLVLFPVLLSARPVPHCFMETGPT
ncbi:hypothetical protein AK812_SmicGene15667 [Symbiodinium microadriaticum]|uniref:Uncharacterized protein n=1 Tax=Symbiodinium microadriaticum TaxID=2951 RepID=A0A1Q9E2G2_SYMMI|nr:hypothetical protein AK812_SmicGene15667 [Symbiodinium microadriaticum]CAE7948984.1 unnamed protein product [Symbiodinium sp. KB8]